MGQARMAEGIGVNELLRNARALRAERRIDESYDLIRRQLAGEPRYRALVWQHAPELWRELRGRNCRLTRRCGSDVSFIRWLWRDTAFMQSFHRLAPALPERDEDLRRILENEFASLIKDSKSIHWVIRDDKGQPWGMLSLSDVSLHHKRAEVLIGLQPDAPFGLAPAAMLLLFRFFFTTLKFNKLYAYTYEDNRHSLRGACHLGFTVEGCVRQQVFDPAQGQFLNLLQISLLREEVFSRSNRRLMERLLEKDNDNNAARTLSMGCLA